MSKLFLSERQSTDHIVDLNEKYCKAIDDKKQTYILFLDTRKAFDSIHHDYIHTLLEHCGLPTWFRTFVRNSLRDVRATPDKGFTPIDVGRGVKQGDPISGLLFIAVMQDILGSLQIKWEQANMRRTGVKNGIQLSENHNLTNLRFGDDVILVAQGKSDIKKMLSQFAERSQRYGLSLHFGKTSILTWDALAGGSSNIQIGSKDVRIIGEHEAEK